MNKINIRRLLHTILPFMIMNMIQRSILLLFQTSGNQIIGTDAVSLIAFIAASAAAILTFRQKTYSDDSGTDTPALPELSAGMCVLLTVPACAVMVTIMYAVSLLAGGGNTSDTGITFTAVLSTLLIHPVLEEIVFRKMFYGELRLMNRVFGCIAQTIMFAILHSTVDGMIYALWSGLVLAILYEHTGRIIPCIAAHIFINLRSLLCITILADMPGVINGLDIALLIGGLVCFTVYNVICSAGRKQEDRENE